MMRDSSVGIASIVLAILVGTAGCATTSAGPPSGAEEKPTNAYDSGWMPVNDSPIRGPEDALVTVVVFNDFLCDACKDLAGAGEYLRRDRDDVRIAYKFYPTSGDAGRMAARAAAYAEKQGKFWEMHDAIIGARPDVRENPKTTLAELGGKVGLDAEKLKSKLEPPSEGDELTRRIDRDVELGRAIGLEGPPAALVNGRLLAGKEELAQWDETFEEARDEVDRLLKGGVASSMLYQTAAGLAYDRQDLADRQRYTGALRAPEGGGGTGGEISLADSEKVPVGDSPVLGPKDAPVTIVEFSDFECPFCQKGKDRIETVRENYPNKVRIVFKQFPLGMHPKAKPAARIALAAREQGDEYFWKFHDRLFERQEEWKNGRLKEIARRWAREMDGFDADQFERDLKKNRGRYDDIIESEMRKGKELGVKGTPHFFVNGRALSGAQPYSRFETAIEDELDHVEELRADGVEKRDLYKMAVRENYEKPNTNEELEQERREKKRKVEHVPVGNAPTRGASADDALVTFVTFGDFQCPFTDKAQPTLERLRNEYGDRVRFVFKHRPLDFHKQAKPAARASVAAAKQGKFWEMHDLIFENQKRLNDDGVFVEFAEELGLNVAKFERDMESDEVKQRVESDNELAKKIGASGTPNFWINGVNVVGAQPYEKFVEVLDKQLERAEKLRDEEGLSGEKLYERAVEVNKKKEGSSGGDEKGGSDDEKKDVKRVDPSLLKVGDSPTRGPEDAPITIYEFSEFEDPYTAKAHPTVQKLYDAYEGKIRHVHKHYPLPFHDDAKPAAKAAIAAQKQGKFWEMYSIMLENQDALGDDEQYQIWADRIGLDVETFKEDMESVSESRIEGDMEMGKEAGVKGTPTFFINGRRLVGAQPYSKFEEIIEEELED